MFEKKKKSQDKRAYVSAVLAADATNSHTQNSLPYITRPLGPLDEDQRSRKVSQGHGLVLSRCAWPLCPSFYKILKIASK